MADTLRLGKLGAGERETRTTTLIDNATQVLTMLNRFDPECADEHKVPKSLSKISGKVAPNQQNSSPARPELPNLKTIENRGELIRTDRRVNRRQH